MSNESPDAGSEAYLSVLQAAKHLSVHPSTIRRWIDQGRLPAYRIGDRRIGVRPTDLARLVGPRLGRPRNRAPAREREHTVARVLGKEQRLGLAAFAELVRLRDHLASKTRPSASPSWKLLNRLRDERTDVLMQAIEE
jgi:excisionase family DNA binding protein